MSKSIVIDKESYTRTKKKLKKSLEAKGASFTLSEVSDILAQSFGFKNEFDMHKNYFESLGQISTQESLSLPLINDQKSLLKSMTEISEGSKIIAGESKDGSSYKSINSHPVWAYGPSPIAFNDVNGNKFDYNPFTANNIDDLNTSHKVSADKFGAMFKKLDLKKNRGNIIVAGKPGSGATILLNAILHNNSDNLVTINHNSKKKESGDLRTKNDLEYVMEKNKKDTDVIFSIAASSEQDALNTIKTLNPNFDISSIRYLFFLHVSKRSLLEIYVYDMSKSSGNLQVFGMAWK